MKSRFTFKTKYKLAKFLENEWDSTYDLKIYQSVISSDYIVEVEE